VKDSGISFAVMTGRCGDVLKVSTMSTEHDLFVRLALARGHNEGVLFCSNETGLGLQEESVPVGCLWNAFELAKKLLAFEDLAPQTREAGETLARFTEANFGDPWGAIEKLGALLEKLQAQLSIEPLSQRDSELAAVGGLLATLIVDVDRARKVPTYRRGLTAYVVIPVTQRSQIIDETITMVMEDLRELFGFEEE
jgi:hypothetical protein